MYSRVSPSVKIIFNRVILRDLSIYITSIIFDRSIEDWEKSFTLTVHSRIDALLRAEMTSRPSGAEMDRTVGDSETIGGGVWRSPLLGYPETSARGADSRPHTRSHFSSEQKHYPYNETRDVRIHAHMTIHTAALRADRHGAQWCLDGRNL